MAIFVFKAARFATTANWEVKLLHPSQSLLSYRKGDIRKRARNKNIKGFISADGDFAVEQHVSSV